MKIANITYAIGLLLLVSCAAPQPKMSSMQRRSLQMRTFDNTTYNTVFRSFKNVLQDEGYIIKNQDMQGGLIVAQIQKKDSSSSFWAALSGNRNYRTGEAFELSVNLEALNSTTVESRMTIQKVDKYSQGGSDGREVLDPEIYRGFYNKVKIEVERRKAMQRK